ncbi:MAG: InlB B-repeat-containing protein [Spirochaetia bacterium]|nr:InlB B-repeat-containing protein [Spirochaetia bacterium]
MIKSRLKSTQFRIAVIMTLTVAFLFLALNGCSFFFPSLRKFSVTFDSLGGTPVQDQQVTDYVTEPSPSPERDGYTFVGWFADHEYLVQWDFSMDIAADDITLYARWSAHTDTDYKAEHYLQHVEDDGYSLYETENLTGTTDTAAEASVNSYTGFSENTEHPDRISSGTIAGDGSLVLKLFYAWNTYTVSFDSMGGAGVANANDVRHGTTISSPGAAFRPGFNFLGWYRSTSFLQEWNFSSDTVIDDKTLYALWEYTTYELRDTGPAGGLIFYDDEDDGIDDIYGRYLEAAPADWYNSPGLDPIHIWGPTGNAVGVTESNIGDGFGNTEILVDEFGSASAAGICSSYTSNEHQNYPISDWYLPSHDELLLLKSNLDNFSLGDFSPLTAYWSSTESSADEAYAMKFSDGSIESRAKAETLLVRPIRGF